MRLWPCLRLAGRGWLDFLSGISVEHFQCLVIKNIDFDHNIRLRSSINFLIDIQRRNEVTMGDKDCIWRE